MQYDTEHRPDVPNQARTVAREVRHIVSQANDQVTEAASGDNWHSFAEDAIHILEQAIKDLKHLEAPSGTVTAPVYEPIADLEKDERKQVEKDNRKAAREHDKIMRKATKDAVEAGKADSDPSDTAEK